MPTPVVVTLTALAALLLSEARGLRIGVWIAKPVASTGFLWAAVAAGAAGGTGASYGRILLLGLALCWWGDVLLIPRRRPAVFRAGVLAFLLGHVAYVVAFAMRGFDVGVALGATLAVGSLGFVVLRWLRSHLPADMRIPVQAYVVVISTMVVCACASVAAAGRPAILIGALMFYASDLAVARDRFVRPGFVNGLWGLPLYYGGQLVLATSAS
jgi:uncharacterized membrane protein YhhN